MRNRDMDIMFAAGSMFFTVYMANSYSKDNTIIFPAILAILWTPVSIVWVVKVWSDARKGAEITDEQRGTILEADHIGRKRK